MKNAEKFFEKTIKTDEAKKYFSSFEKPKSQEEIIKIYSEVAEKLGIDLSEEEITEYLNEMLNTRICSGEIDDNELSQLSGGNNHACADTFLHAENCWNKDGCDYLYNDYEGYLCSWSYEGECAIFDKSSSDDLKTSPKFG